EAVIINLGSGMYYSMTGTGGFLWSLVESHYSMAEAADILSSSYGISRDTALADIRRLWEKLLAEELVVVASDQSLAKGEASPAGANGSPYEAPVLTKFQDMVDLFAADPPLPELPEVAVSTQERA